MPGKSVETTIMHVDRVRTRENSRITLRFSDLSVALWFAERVCRPPPRQTSSGFSLSRGLLYFFHRDKPAALQINTRTAARHQ